LGFFFYTEKQIENSKLFHLRNGTVEDVSPRL
jgi:hypothetical protein